MTKQSRTSIGWELTSGISHISKAARKPGEIMRASHQRSLAGCSPWGRRVRRTLATA